MGELFVENPLSNLKKLIFREEKYPNCSSEEGVSAAVLHFVIAGVTLMLQHQRK